MNESAGLNIKYGSGDKPLDCRGRNTPKSTYGRKIYDLPKTDIVDDMPKDKKYNFNIRIKQGNSYTYLYRANTPKDKDGKAPAIFPNGLTKDHRNEA